MKLITHIRARSDIKHSGSSQRSAGSFCQAAVAAAKVQVAAVFSFSVVWVGRIMYRYRSKNNKNQETFAVAEQKPPYFTCKEAPEVFL